MLKVTNLKMQFGSRILFKDVNLEFTNGNCYGIIGANGAGKSTLIKILSQELEPTEGQVIIPNDLRLSVLKQDQNAFNDLTVIDTVIAGHKRLVELKKLREDLYNKGADLSEEEGIKLGDYEAEFFEIGGYEAEANAENLLNGLQVTSEYHYLLMKDCDAKIKVKVLLAQALFGNPDILLLDEPTNNLDYKSALWLENFLLNFENTVLVVSHDRHFLNNVCTHICDVDYGQINLFIGNYDFWYDSSQLLLKQQKDQNKKAQEKRKELEEFIQRFSANKSKSRQATSRKKLLEKIVIEDLKPSSRRYPFIGFKQKRELGNDVLSVENLTVPGLFKNLTFTLNKDDRVAILADNTLAVETLFNILAGRNTEYEGDFKFGVTVNPGFLIQNNNYLFQKAESLVDWLKVYSPEDQTDTFIRSFLGRMLFSGEEALKMCNVLSGGERIRMILSKLMLEEPNMLVFEDPTNHLDLESITALNNGMLAFKGAIIFSSHDTTLLESVSNRLIYIDKDGNFKDLQMSYADYIGDLDV